MTTTGAMVTQVAEIVRDEEGLPLEKHWACIVTAYYSGASGVQTAYLLNGGSLDVDVEDSTADAIVAAIRADHDAGRDTILMACTLNRYKDQPEIIPEQAAIVQEVCDDLKARYAAATARDVRGALIKALDRIDKAPEWGPQEYLDDVAEEVLIYALAQRR